MAATSDGSLRKGSMVEGRSSQLCLALPFLLQLLICSSSSAAAAAPATDDEDNSFKDTSILKSFPRFHPGLRTSSSPGTF